VGHHAAGLFLDPLVRHRDQAALSNGLACRDQGDVTVKRTAYYYLILPLSLSEQGNPLGSDLEEFCRKLSFGIRRNQRLLMGIFLHWKK
jgi:hypothetical protein